MSEASCSAVNTSCSDDVRTWALSHGTGFLSRRLGLKRLTVALPLLLRCVPAEQTVRIVDVGAAIHGLAYPWNMKATGLRDDDSDSLWLIGGFGRRAHVHAFEPNPDKAEELRQAATQRPYTSSFSGQLTVHSSGVGAAVTSARLVQCGNNSLSFNNMRLEMGVVGSACQGKPALHAVVTNATSLDAFAYGGRVASPDLLYVKVDVEGGEWEVLRGMHRLLSEGRVSVASFEYAEAWHPLFSLRRPLSRAEVAQARATSLRALQERMGEYGYDTYLINAAPSRVVLVPVHGHFWHDDLEICANRERYYGSWGQWCWNDVLVVKRGSCAKHVLFEEILPATGALPRRSRPYWTPGGAIFSRPGSTPLAPDAPGGPQGAYRARQPGYFPRCDCM